MWTPCLVSLQHFICPTLCTCKSHAVHCANVGIDLPSFSLNTTLLYLINTTSINMEQIDPHFTEFTNLLLVNISWSRIPLQIIHKFLIFQPNLRVLYMRSSNITHLGNRIFRNLEKLSIIDLQLNAIHSLTSECMLGLVNVLELDFHQMSIRYIHQQAFGDMDALVSLNLSHNNFDVLNKNIFRDLASLKYVDLTHNVFINIDIRTFQGLDITVFASSSVICCYAKSPVSCAVKTLR